MPRLIWSPSALLDVRRLYRFLAEKNIDAAQRAVKAIRESIRIIALQPHIGRPADDMEPEFREWMIEFGDSGYVALYRYVAELDTLFVLAIGGQKEAGYTRA